MKLKALLITVTVLAVSLHRSSSAVVPDKSEDAGSSVSRSMANTNKLLRGMMSSVTTDFSQMIASLMKKNLNKSKTTATGKSGHRFSSNGKSAEFSFFNFDASKERKSASFMNFQVQNGAPASTKSGSASQCPNVRIESKSSGGKNGNKTVECLAECPRGYQVNREADQLCVPCSAGSSKNSTGNQNCEACASGTFSAFSKAGSTACTLCPAGSSSGPGASACTKCKAGFYASAGAATCAPCPAGSFTDQEGKTTCRKCPTGRSSGPGAATCGKCKAGTFFGGSTCTPCAAGQFSDTEGSTSCKECTAGTYSSAGSASCTKCPAGQYSSANSSRCIACPPGTFSSVVGATRCQQCDLNFALARKSGMDRCDLCPDSGATRNSSSCYSKVIATCENATNGMQFAKTPKKMCDNTIDNNRATFGSSASRKFLVKHRLHQFPTFFRYTFQHATRLRRIAIWPKAGAPIEDLYNVNLNISPFKANCIVDETKGKKSGTDSYLFIDFCGANSVTSVDLTYWKKKRAFAVSEIAFYAD